ncbi:hypothetical protein MAR_017105 [Mya arenaria]|uniref:Uncharacterized protein n=1 Tax=Mya arenaria TaxID=6604 RepID=A0ABY7EAS8_MYAAR|nr:hypothetical protein MAR_017105 [Mya arenaria]
MQPHPARCRHHPVQKQRGTFTYITPKYSTHLGEAEGTLPHLRCGAVRESNI